MSVTGMTETDSGIIAAVVDRDNPEWLERNEMEASDQSINGLKRRSQLCPRTSGNRESRVVIYTGIIF